MLPVKKSIKNNNRYLIKKSKKQNLVFYKKRLLQLKTIILYCPSKWVYYIIENKLKKVFYFKLYHTAYYYHFALSTDAINLHADNESSIIYFSSYQINTDLARFFKNLNMLLKLLKTFTFMKIKFKGKGYYLYKNKRNTITPQFGYSHRIYLYTYFNVVKFLTKTKILIFGFSKRDILRASYNLKSKRPINIFTGRGVRFAKQIIYKKTGKVSMYR